MLNDLRDHRISQMDAADILHLSTRQVRRLLSLLNEQGASAFLVNRLSTYL
ncbi:helix-turn-helix domain-containing protein [Vibrio natriegens]|uniref:helix-turn-helix domain-containing protein n=1 Tax=Vibrio natriegens TaxID=691 RepID=UPI0039A64FF2